MNSLPFHNTAISILCNAIVGGFAIVVAVCFSSAFADGPDNVDYRQNIMKTLGEQTSAVFMILEQKAPRSDLDKHIKALAIISTQVLSAFEPHAKGGDAKPIIWDNWEDFASKARAQVEKFNELNKAAENGDLEPGEVKQAFTCKNCHDDYRVEK
jgi:cytochrome c556